MKKPVYLVILVLAFGAGTQLPRLLGPRDPIEEIRDQLQHFAEEPLHRPTGRAADELRKAFAPLKGKVPEGKAAVVVYGSPG